MQRKQEELYTTICRPALPLDRADMIEVTRHIWEGHDYVPKIWDEWLADPEGLLAVAQYGPQVVGLGKLTRFTPTDWWLEGLRVHPEYEGTGIASRLTEYLMAHWLKIGQGSIRLATSSSREKVHHLCERYGMRRVLEFSTFNSEPLREATTAFTPLKADEISKAVDFARQSPSVAFSAGFMDLGWQWVPVNEYTLAESAEQGMAWWWRDGEGLLAIAEDREEEVRYPLIQLIACPLESLVECLQDYRRLAHQLGYLSANWAIPLQPDLLHYTEAAGLQRDWEGSLYLFERRHPQRP